MIRQRPLFIFCLAGLMLCLAWSAPAQDRDSTVLDATYFKKLFFETVTKGAPWPTDKLEVSNFSFTPTSITMPPGVMTCRIVNQLQPEYLGRKVLTMALLSDGVEIERVKMQGDIELFDDVVIVKKNIGRATVLTEEDVQVQRRNITMLGNNLLQDLDAVLGKRLKTAMRAGEVLLASAIENTPVIKRGDLVTIMAESRGLSVAVSGEAKSAGAPGEVVRVKNLTSRREVLARVVDSQTVKVEF